MKYKLLLIACLVYGLGWGQILTFEFSALAGNESTANSSTNASGLGNSIISRGPGLTASTNSGRFNSVDWAVSSIDNAISGNDYVQFTITPNSGYQFNISSIVVQWQRSATGNTQVVLRNSIDNYATNIDGVKSIVDNTSTQTLTWTFSQNNTSSPITYRLYSFAESTAGSGGPGDGTGDDIIVNGTVSSLPITTTYTTSWSNSAPTTTTDAIIDGNLTTSTDLTCKDLTINSGKTLTIGAGKKLTVAGNLINNGSIVFKSDATGTAMFDVFNGTQSGTGLVTVERFIPQGKRAFRLLSPAVTTTAFISGNWQQGTHITGGATGGFDITETNNPSMFTYNNQVASGTGWTTIANTNATNLTAGVGYRVLIRGDRNVNLNSQSNGNMNASVTLAATGALKTGAVTLNSSSIPAINDQNNATTANYSLVGNPYASAIDWHAVTKTGIEDTYYAWDPNLGTGNDRGRYVSYSQSTTTTSILNGSGSTNIGRHIQSGQAFFVKNTVSGTPGTLTFNESNKSTTQAAVFRSANTELAKIYLTLYDATEFSVGGYPIDGTVAVFGQDFETNLGVGDVQKLETNGQNVMFLRDNKKLAIEATSLPVFTDELQVINTNAQPNKNYTWRINMSALPSTVTPYLVDAFLGTQTALPVNQEHIISFATTDAVASMAINRFKIVFTTSALHNDTFTNQIGLYPNPSKGNGFNLQLPSTAEASVKLFNTLGQEIGLTNNGNTYQAVQSLPTGVYYIMVTQGMQTSKLKWIVE